ncbi:MAG: MBL fold metallo-hydrolase [Thermomicrobiales bacterium]|nr:MBL fold metallo-hydrolase [Thermomicrobiales bacterium]
MMIDRIFTPGLAQVAYLIADDATGDVAVIDPRRDIDPYLDWAATRGMRISAILETHVHADFVSGARELAAATGAPVYASRLGDTEFPHVPLDDQDEVAVGNLRLRALWTPGHTPEHLAYLLFDPARGEAPVAMFSGDVLFAGEIGRPDLLGPEAQQRLIVQLYDTVEQRLKPLPDDLVVYPGHTAGSPCGKRIGDAPQTTIGQERARNYAFNQPDREHFVRAVMAGMPKPPAYYPVMKRVNKVGPALLRDLPAAQPLSPAEVAAQQAAGALVIDARPAAAFAQGHVPGALTLPLGPNFAIWAGWLTPYDREIILVLPADGHYVEAQTELRRIGIDRVAGYLADGVAAWQEGGRPLATLETILPAELGARFADYRVLDVRDWSEYETGSLPGAIHAPAGDLAQGAAAPVSAGGTTAIICGSGYRSALAASLLQQQGVEGVVNVAGGLAAWRAAGLPFGAAEAAAPALVDEPLEITLREYLAARSGAPLQVVDVRGQDEWSSGHLQEARLVPLDQLPARQHELDPGLPVVTVCRSGRRSLEAASYLREQGFANARSLAGGMIAWAAANQPVMR